MEQITYRKVSEFPKGTLKRLLIDGYSFDERYQEACEKDWQEFDDFFYSNLSIADRYGFITTLGDEAIGFVSWDPRNMPKYAEIGHNCIATKYKGNGYGEAQMKEAVRRILRYPVQSIIVGTNDDLVPAQKTYESAGLVLKMRKKCREDDFVNEHLYYEMDCSEPRVVRIVDGSRASHLYEGMQDTSIWSCLQNVMGQIYGVEDKETRELVSAMAVQSEFIFFAGKPNEELVRFTPEEYPEDFAILVPPTKEWEDLIEKCYPTCHEKVTRYAIKKEPDVFDQAKLEAVVDALPKEFEISLFDETIYNQCKEQEWSMCLVGSYPDYDTFAKLGLGVAIRKDGELVAGAASYSSYLEGIEIEIDTREDYRRCGLAYTTGARLILECLCRGLYPSWDAQNPWSVALSEKLGYHFSHEYVAYEIFQYRTGGEECQ